MKTSEQWRSVVDDKLSEHTFAKKTCKAEKKALIIAEDNLTDAQEAQIIIQQIAQGIQEKAHKRIAGVVSSCLAAVFPEDPYTFHIEFDRKRGKTDARLLLKRDGHVVDPMTSTGGGVIDVAAFALRVSCLVLARPALRKVLVMDEPMKFVSADHRDRVRDMIEKLSEDFNVQFIMVTHCDELVCGNVIRL